MWGQSQGQLDVGGDTVRKLEPTLVTGQLQGETAVYIALGGRHTLSAAAGAQI